MKHATIIFHFQNCIESIRKEAKERAKKGKPLSCEPLLKTITEDTELEDLPMYKNYLSRFNVEHDFADLDLRLFPSLIKRHYYDDYLMFIRFVAASSLIISYEFVYDANAKDVDMVITFLHEGKPRTVKCSDFHSYNMRGGFKDFVLEQLDDQSSYGNPPSMNETMDEKRDRKVREYQQKIKKLHDELERMQRDQKDIENTLSELDELLAE